MNYTLTCGTNTAVVQTLGAELISFKDANDTEYVWTGDATYWSSHAPVLFPIVGALKNNTVTFGGKAYEMPKHGIVRKREWTFVSQTDNSITLEIVSDETTLAQYPFEFCLQVTHTICESGFTTTYNVRNTGNKTMGMCLGGHAGFCCPLFPEESFDDYQLLFDCEEDCKPLYTDAAGVIYRNQRQELMEDGQHFALNYSKFDNDLVLFDDIKSKVVSLKNTKTQNGICFSFEGFTHLGVWTPPTVKAPFICLEPWKGLPAWDDETGAFEDKPDTVSLPAGETYQAHYTMYILGQQH